ncbi:PRTRC system protein E [Caballeronia sp. KNU42]
MSLFSSLHPLAQKATLIVLITAEGDQLRVNVTPQAAEDKPGKKTLYPLSILAAPDELDRDFAEAVSIYEPGVLSVIDQAYRASAANGGSKATTPALLAPGAITKGKPGRKPKSTVTDTAAEKTEPADPADQSATPAVDPRQTSIPGIDSGAATQIDQPENAPANTVEQATAESDDMPDAGALDLM